MGTGLPASLVAETCPQKFIEMPDDATPQDMYEEGLSFLERGCINPAFTLFKIAAQNQHPVAQFQLGMMAAQGIGLKRPNLRGAFKYFSLAADQGYPDAMVMTATFYEGDNKVTKGNPEKAFDLYERAAKAGSQAGIARVVEIYANGELGQPKSPEKEAYWKKRLQ